AQRVEPVGALGDLAEQQPAGRAAERRALVDPVDDRDPGRLGVVALGLRLALGLARPPGRRLQRGGGRGPGHLWHLVLGPRELAHRGARRVEVLADAVQRLARVARREDLELAVDRVARADLDEALLDARVEAVQRAHRRAADDRAAEVVDAAVARADEALSGLDVVDRAAE